MMRIGSSEGLSDEELKREVPSQGFGQSMDPLISSSAY